MKKAKILLVDDKPENLLSLKIVIEGDDREILLANSGNEGLRLARQHDLALILTDVQMPEMDGFEMVELLRMNNNTNKIPVIFVTALSKDQKYVEKGYSEGAVDYLSKPLDPEIVRAKVDNFVTLYKQRIKLVEQNAHLERLNEEKNRFLGMAAHDIRNPLLAIEYFSKNLLDYFSGLSDKHYEEAEHIYTSARFIQNLVNELLDFSTIESGKTELDLQLHDPGVLINETTKLNRLLAQKKDISIITKVSLEPVKILIDGSKMLQVLNNLLTNAIKFSNRNSEIEIGAHLNNNTLHIWVKDQGQGIPDKEQENLFKPFVKTSVRSTEGEPSSGLGLAIVKRIIDAHQGQITVDSHVGEGTNFNLSIPFQLTESPQKSLTPDNLDKNLIGSGISIHIIEDNIVVQLMLQTNFNRYGFNVEVFSDAESCIVAIKERRPDIVFSDLQLPGMSGYEFAEIIQQEFSGLPVVALTASVTNEVRNTCKSYGIQHVYDKSISKQAVEDVLKVLNIYVS